MHSQDPIDRLFCAARRATEGVGEPTAAFEARALRAWREAGAEEDILWILPLVRRALLLSCAVILACFVLGWPSASRELFTNELIVADAIMKTSLLP